MLYLIEVAYRTLLGKSCITKAEYQFITKVPITDAGNLAYGRFDSLSVAKEKCLYEEQCSGVVNPQCNENYDKGYKNHSQCGYYDLLVYNDF